MQTTITQKAPIRFSGGNENRAKFATFAECFIWASAFAQDLDVTIFIAFISLHLNSENEEMMAMASRHRLFAPEQ